MEHQKYGEYPDANYDSNGHDGVYDEKPDITHKEVVRDHDLNGISREEAMHYGALVRESRNVIS